MAAGSAVAVLACYAILTQPPRGHLISRPVQFLRESVLLTRPTLNPFDARNSRIITVTTLATPEVYDPNIHRVKSAGELIAILRKADLAGYPVFVNQGYSQVLRDKEPAIAALIYNPKFFEKVTTLPGMEGMFDRDIFRYHPSSISGLP
jgi:hypothetical protein